MKQILMIVPLLVLAACDAQAPMVRNGDLTKAIEAAGYTKVMYGKGNLNCGRYGKGKHFLAKRKDGDSIIGQICYKKADGKVTYKVDVNKVIPKTSDVDLSDPWRKKQK